MTNKNSSRKESGCTDAQSREYGADIWAELTPDGPKMKMWRSQDAMRKYFTGFEAEKQLFRNAEDEEAMLLYFDLLRQIERLEEIRDEAIEVVRERIGYEDLDPDAFEEYHEDRPTVHEIYG
jgi:23S rRNA maturation mini-RNase III